MHLHYSNSYWVNIHSVGARHLLSVTAVVIFRSTKYTWHRVLEVWKA